MNLFYDFQRVGVTVIIASHEVPQAIPEDVQAHVQILHLHDGELSA
jgi:ABC-type ATPase involved in cell division